MELNTNESTLLREFLERELDNGGNKYTNVLIKLLSGLESLDKESIVLQTEPKIEDSNVEEFMEKYSFADKFNIELQIEGDFVDVNLNAWDSEELYTYSIFTRKRSEKTEKMGEKLANDYSESYGLELVIS